MYRRVESLEAKQYAVFVHRVCRYCARSAVHYGLSFSLSFAMLPKLQITQITHLGYLFRHVCVVRKGM